MVEHRDVLDFVMLQNTFRSFRGQNFSRGPTEKASDYIIQRPCNLPRFSGVQKQHNFMALRGRRSRQTFLSPLRSKLIHCRALQIFFFLQRRSREWSVLCSRHLCHTPC